MANIDHEKASNTSDSYPQVGKHGKRDDVAYVLDERRRAALADVDNAKFSYVSYPALLHGLISDDTVGSMSKCVSLQVSASSRTRECTKLTLVLAEIFNDFQL